MNERKELKKKLLTAVKKIIHDSQADLTHKTEKALKKAIKGIVKKTAKNRNSGIKLKNEDSRLESDKEKLNGSTVVLKKTNLTNSIK